MILSRIREWHRTGYELLINPTLRAPAYVGLLAFIWLLTATSLALGALFLVQAGAQGLIFLLGGAVFGCTMTFFYSRGSIAVDRERVYRTAGDKRNSVERSRVKKVLYRGGGQLLDADGKMILQFGLTFTPNQMEALAKHLGVPYRRYQKPKK